MNHKEHDREISSSNLDFGIDYPEKEFASIVIPAHSKIAHVDVISKNNTITVFDLRHVAREYPPVKVNFILAETDQIVDTLRYQFVCGMFIYGDFHFLFMDMQALPTKDGVTFLVEKNAKYPNKANIHDVLSDIERYSIPDHIYPIELIELYKKSSSPNKLTTIKTNELGFIVLNGRKECVYAQVSNNVHLTAHV